MLAEFLAFGVDALVVIGWAYLVHRIWAWRDRRRQR